MSVVVQSGYQRPNLARDDMVVMIICRARMLKVKFEKRFLPVLTGLVMQVDTV